MQEPCIPYIERDEDNPMPSLLHSRVAHNLSVLPDRYSDRFDVHQQVSLRLGEWATVPDLALFPKEREVNWLNDKDEVVQPPKLVIEILSPHQVAGNLITKVRDYLQNGVGSCWLVQPSINAVTVFPASSGSRTFGEGNVEDPALGISLPISGIFR